MSLPKDCRWLIDKSLTILLALVERKKNDYDLKEWKKYCSRLESSRENTNAAFFFRQVPDFHYSTNFCSRIKSF